MNIRILLPCLIAALVISSRAADWESMKRSPASIQVVNMQPKPLAVSTDKKGWAQIPDQLIKYNAVIFDPTSSTNGVADVTVLADGWMLVACNYGYQGNTGGNWDEEVWNEKKFQAKGWHLLSKNELGGILVKGDNHEQVIFCKQVRKGDKIRMRCNKYDPPFPILLTPK